MIEITEHLSIPTSEISYATSRSGGPGGQHVNKVSSRVTLLFHVAASPSLSEAQKRLILSRLATRVNQAGVLRVVSQQHRSQAANREVALERFVILLRQALRRTPRRTKTAIPAAVKRRRLDDKRHRGQMKQQRTKPDASEA